MRYLQDTFLPAYRDAIDANARMVMVNSSSIDGVPATASRFLQTTLLRQRLGFSGVTISDYKDVQALSTAYHVAPDLAGAIAMAVNAGLDMAMWVEAPDQWQANVLADVANGTISQARIDEAVRRILRLKFELGLFDQPCVQDVTQPCVDPDAAEAAVQAGRDVTLDAARESITLLKNTSNVLPIGRGARVVVTGANADSMVGQLGGWSVSWQGVSTSGHACCEAPPGQILPGTTVLDGIRNLDPVRHGEFRGDELPRAGRERTSCPYSCTGRPARLSCLCTDWSASPESSFSRASRAPSTSDCHARGWP